MKKLDHEELWDSFTRGERHALFVQISYKKSYDLTPEIPSRKWRDLPTTLKFELQALDWEFSLGKRFASPS